MIFDKRGVGKSKSKEAGIFEAAGAFDLMDDVAAAADFLAKEEASHPSSTDKALPFLLIGHSEGGINIPGIWARIDPSSGVRPTHIVFLSSFGETLRSALEFQRVQLTRELDAKRGFKGWLMRLAISKEKMEKGVRDMDALIETHKEPYRKRFFGLVKEPIKWFREHYKEYDTFGLMKEIKGVHALAITGGKDIQCSSSHLADATKANSLIPGASTFKCHIIPDMNHMLRNQMKAIYRKSCRMPIDPQLTAAISEWFKETTS